MLSWIFIHVFRVKDFQIVIYSLPSATLSFPASFLRVERDSAHLHPSPALTPTLTSRQAFLVYSSSIYSDMGNYRDFGDTKKVPGVAQDKFAALVRASRAYETDSKTMERLLDGCLARLYTLNDSVAQLGLGDKVTERDRFLHSPRRRAEGRAAVLTGRGRFDGEGGGCRMGRVCDSGKRVTVGRKEEGGQKRGYRKTIVILLTKRKDKYQLSSLASLSGMSEVKYLFFSFALLFFLSF